MAKLTAAGSSWEAVLHRRGRRLLCSVEVLDHSHGSRVGCYVRLILHFSALSCVCRCLRVDKPPPVTSISEDVSKSTRNGCVVGLNRLSEFMGDRSVDLDLFQIASS